MKGGHNHRVYPILVSSDEEGQEEPTAQDDHEDEEEEAEEASLVANSNRGPSEPVFRLEPNSIYERRKAQVKWQRKWSAQRQRAKEKQRSSAVVVSKTTFWQQSTRSIAVGVVVGVILVAVLLWNREERLSGTCVCVFILRKYVCLYVYTCMS